MAEQNEIKWRWQTYRESVLKSKDGWRIDCTNYFYNTIEIV